jgi:hypothetical protein
MEHEMEYPWNLQTDGYPRPWISMQHCCTSYKLKHQALFPFCFLHHCERICVCLLSFAIVKATCHIHHCLLFLSHMIFALISHKPFLSVGSPVASNLHLIFRVNLSNLISSLLHQLPNNNLIYTIKTNPFIPTFHNETFFFTTTLLSPFLCYLQ